MPRTHNNTLHYSKKIMDPTVGTIKNLVLNLPRLGIGDWWIEIVTSEPNCVYYFGPFSNLEEASSICPDYIQDLINEGAQNVSTTIKRCHPTELTKFSEGLTLID